VQNHVSNPNHCLTACPNSLAAAVQGFFNRPTMCTEMGFKWTFQNAKAEVKSEVILIISLYFLNTFMQACLLANMFHTEVSMNVKPQK
jgi:hypothetical protein